ncbi:MAG: class I SAM-dependent methyltransferase [Geminicoccaceae bacterium]
MTECLLADHRQLWHQKPALREVYSYYYREIAAICRSGRTLEIGGGIGNFKTFMPDVISSDIQPSVTLDVVADAQRLPFAQSSFENIVMFDVLHHLEQPLMFLAEAARVLQPGGRIVVCEPAITPLSRVFYRLFHPEPFDMKADLLAEASLSRADDPWDSNQAVPTLMFGRQRTRIERHMPELSIRRARLLAMLAYPLSGGFRPWSAIAAPLVKPLLAIERRVEPLLGPLMAFRLLGVIEKAQ